MDSQRQRASSGSEREKTKGHSAKSTEMARLEHIVADYKEFEAFMRHLCREFSMENLLAIVEFTQFKAELLKCQEFAPEDRVVVRERATSAVSLLQFCKEVPQSDLVYEKIDTLMERRKHERTLSSPIGTGQIAQLDEIKGKDVRYQFFVRASFLYDRYVHSDGELELNLSSRVKQRMTEEMEQERKQLGGWSFVQLHSYFDDAMDCVAQLLQDSIRRFHYSASHVEIERRSNNFLVCFS
jgi:hypothetical protein